MDRRDPGVTRCSREMQEGKRNITARGCCLCGVCVEEEGRGGERPRPPAAFCGGE